MAESIDDTESFSIPLETVAELAKGQIVDLTYPSSVPHGEQFDVNASMKNIGGASGLFKMELWVDSGLRSTCDNFLLEPGATSTDKIGATDAPTTGTSMSCIVKCIRVASF